MKKQPNPLNQIKLPGKRKFIPQSIEWLRGFCSELERKLGSGEFRFLNDEIQRFLYSDISGNVNDAEYEYMGNFVICNRKSLFETKEYKESIKKMCCGIVQFEIGPSKSNNFYLVAFDHGH